VTASIRKLIVGNDHGTLNNHMYLVVLKLHTQAVAASAPAACPKVLCR
jgi:hypothetical protein